MDINSTADKLKSMISKYKYAGIVLLIGLALLLIPGGKQEEIKQAEGTGSDIEKLDEMKLANLLQSVEGAGSVQVMLSVASGEKTIYQTDQDTSGSGESHNSKTQTVIISDSQRNETGLINQINPPVYLGAIVVCQGADSPAVKLAIIQAVSKITGLGTEKICVLKMK